MTNVEGWLLERMSVRRWIISMICVVALAGWIGWNLGERHIANAFAEQVQASADQMRQAMIQSGLAK